MKYISYNVAKSIKEAGYPYNYEDVNIIENCEGNERKWNFWSKLVGLTYLEVWLWLWREKKICINCNLDKYNLIPQWWCTNEDGINYNTPNFNDPEEAIIAAIEYLVENDLIK